MTGAGADNPRPMESELKLVFKDLLAHQDRIEARKEAQFPDIRWDGSRRKCHYL